MNPIESKTQPALYNMNQDERTNPKKSLRLEEQCVINLRDYDWIHSDWVSQFSK